MTGNIVRLFDNTRLSVYKSCPRKYLLEHLYDLRPTQKSTALIFGSSWHTAMDVIWREHAAPRADFPRVVDLAFAAFLETWQENGMPHPDKIDPDEMEMLLPRTPQVALEMLWNYIEARQYIFKDPSFKLIDIERPFAVPLDPNDPTLFYVGRLDKIFEFRGQILVGEHKCLGEGTLIMKFDGSTVPVESLQTGDLLMGPDSLPRRITSVCSGVQELFKVTPIKGESYIVNKAHILSLKMTTFSGKFRCGSGKYGSGEIANVSVTDYLATSDGFRKTAYGWRPDKALTFSQKPAPHPHLPPYILGAWLGDGTTNAPSITSKDSEVVQEFVEYAAYRGLKLTNVSGKNRCPTYQISSAGTGHGRKHVDGVRPENHFLKALQAHNLIGNKHVPDSYKLGSPETRLEVLAGFIDTDGGLQQNGGGGYRISQKSKQVADDICFIARSLGLAAYVYARKSTCTQTGAVGDYYWIYISGACGVIPCRIAKKRSMKLQTTVKDVSKTSIVSVESVGPGRYYGFELEGPDRLFLLGDFTVTHNTTTSYKKNGPFRSDFIDSFSPNSQVDGYSYALRSMFGERASGVWIDAALVHKQIHDGFMFIPVDRQFAQLDAWLWETMHWVDMVEGNLAVLNERSALDGPYLAAFPKNTGNCGSYGGCPMQSLCKTIANPAKMREVPLGYRLESWSPFDVVKLEKLGFEPANEKKYKRKWEELQ